MPAKSGWSGIIGVNMIVTKHFNSLEFSQPSCYGIPFTLYPGKWIDSRLMVLCTLLESIREKIDSPIKIISGYRSEEWNNLHIKSGHKAAKNSMHIHGLAADITSEVSIAELEFACLYVHERGLGRIGGLGVYRSFVHVDVRYIIPDMTGKLITWRG